MPPRLYGIEELSRVIGETADRTAERVRSEIRRDRQEDFEQLQRSLGIDPENPDEAIKDRLWVRQRRLAEGSLLNKVVTVILSAGALGFVGFFAWAVKTAIFQLKGM